MDLLHSAVIGNPQPQAWSSAVWRRVGESGLGVVVGLRDLDGAPTAGRRLMTFFGEWNFEGLSWEDVYAGWQAAIEEVKEFLSIAVVVVRGEELLVLTSGEASVALLREHKRQWLIDGGEPQPVLMGNHHPGDVLILATRAGRTLCPDIQHLQVPGSEEFASRIAGRVAQVPDGALLWVESRSPQERVEKTEVEDGEKVGVVAGEAEDQSNEVVQLPVASEEVVANSANVDANQNDKNQDDGRFLFKQRASQTGEMPSQRWGWLKAWQEQRKAKMIGLAVAGFLVIAVIGLLVWGGAQRRAADQALLGTLRTELATVSGLSDAQRAEKRARAAALKGEVEVVPVKTAEGERARRELLTQVEAFLEEVAGEQQLSSIPAWFDFRLIAPDFIAQAAAVNSDTAIFLDQESGRILQLNLISKQGEVMRVTFPGAQAVAIQGTSYFVIKDKEVWQGSLAGGEPTLYATMADAQKPVAAQVFGDFLYVLDPPARALWRVGAGEDGAIAATNWWRAPAGLELDRLQSLAIDGEVWVTSDAGQIARLVRGDRLDFALSEMPEPIAHRALVATNPTENMLYFLIPEEKRLVATDKNGVYWQAVVSDDLAASSSIFVGSEPGTVYILSGTILQRVVVPPLPTADSPTQE